MTDNWQFPGPAAMRREDPPVVPDHELLRRIGGGSYGEVWLARNVMGAYRAVKIIYRDSFEDDRPFQREYSGIQKFEPISRTHESQVDILHVGKTAGCFYYVMELADDTTSGSVIDPEYYHPRTLRTDLSRRGHLPVEECIAVGMALATALDHLHRHGLVHRDIKPSNIIFVNGIPKLADIGLVAAHNDTRSFVGTEGFLPPEGPGTPQADLFSLGKVLYEMATGLDRQDFPELPTVLLERTEQSKLLEFNAILTKACKHDPRHRYQTARELHADLSLLQSGKSIRRMRTLERRISALTNAGIGAALVAGIMFGAFFLQRRQTKEARDLAAENQRLAENSRRLSARLQTAHGTRLVAQGERASAALIYAQSLSLLDSDPQQQPLQRFRAEWIVRDSPAIEQIFPHEGAVNLAIFSPDHRQVLTASDDGTAQIWDATNGTPVVPPLRHRGRVLFAAFSPDGSKIATAGTDRVAQLWDARTGKLLGEPLQHDKSVQFVVFSPDSTRLVTSGLDGARIWDTATTQPLTSLLAHSGPFVECASLSPDGTLLLTGGQDHLARLWDARSGELKNTLKHNYPIDRVAFSPDGARIVTATGKAGSPYPSRLWVWEAASGELLKESAAFPGHGIGFAEFSKEGPYILLGSNPLVIYNTESGKIRPTLSQGALRDVSLATDGDAIATASETGSFAHVWSLRTGNNLYPALKHGGYVNSVRFSSDGTGLLTASDDGAARLWNLAAAYQPLLLKESGAVVQASFAANGEEVISTTHDGIVTFWESSGKRLRTLSTSNHFGGLQLSADGQTVMTAPMRFAYFSSVQQGNRKQILISRANQEKWFSINAEFIAAAALSRDGKLLAGGTHFGGIQIWSIDSGEVLGEAAGHRERINHLSFSPDGGTLISTSTDGSACLWNIKTKQIIARLRHEYSINHAAFSHNSGLVATVSLDQTTRIWNATNGHPLTPPLKHTGNLMFCAFSPDDRLLVTCGLASFARVWNAKTGEQVTSPLEHTLAVHHAAFHPTEPILLTCSEDKTARLWDLTTGEPLTPPLVHNGRVYYGQFAADGKTFLTTSGDSSIRIWKMPEGDTPAAQLLRETRLLASHSSTETGAMIPEKPTALLSHVQQLRSLKNNAQKRGD